MDPIISAKLDLNNNLSKKIATNKAKVDVGVLNDAHFPKFIKWIREPSETGADLALKIGFVALTVLAALTIVGLIVVIPGMIMGGIEWNRQIQVVQIPKPPVENPKTEEQKKKRKQKRGESKISLIASGKTENKKEIDLSSSIGKKGQNLNLFIGHSASDSDSDDSTITSSDQDSSESITEIISTELELSEAGRVKMNESILLKINVIQLRELLNSNGISFIIPTQQPFNVNAYWKLKVHNSKSESKEHPQMISIKALDFSENMRKSNTEPLRAILNDIEPIDRVDHSLMNDRPDSEPQVVELPDDYKSLSSESSLEEDPLKKDLVETLDLINMPSTDNQDDSVQSALVIQENVVPVLSSKDEKSLNNLAKIKENQIIDIYVDDVVSEPYDDVKKGYVWSTVSWLAGYGTNNDNDIAKIENLMNRSLYAHSKGCKSVKPQLEESLKGLKNLRDHYLSNGRNSTSEILVRIIQEVEMALNPKQERARMPLMLLDV
ncbi:MAG: hypothetical protein H0T62_12530 [Parachlamydiaceae bacterium]|nr:hypothetical protein [Parachlamydiaceae bacterium]